MAVVIDDEGKLGHALKYYTDGVVDITSVLVGTPDAIIPWFKVAPKHKVNIAIEESNGIVVNIQPWCAIREPVSIVDGDEIEYAPATPHWVIAANGRDHIMVDSDLQALWYQVTGYVAAGTAKVLCHILIVPD